MNSEQKENNIKVSVIVPVYNASRYLQESIKSIMSQTLRDIEIIPVNDGSTDNSLEILRTLAVEDSRIRVFSQENGGAGAARNRGLSEAKGEYVSFLDCDDLFDADMLKTAYETAKKYSSDVCVFSGDRYFESEGRYETVKGWCNEKYIQGRDVISANECNMLLQTTNPAPWNKLFKREFILNNELQFQELSNANDLYFTYASLADAQSIAYINRRLIHYREDAVGSIQKKKRKEPDAFIMALLQLKQHLIETKKFGYLKKSYYNLVLDQICFNLRTISEDTHEVLVNLIRDNLEAFGIQNCSSEVFVRKKNYKLYKEEILKMPKVSVVMPVYNVEAYLRETLDSILNQTLRDIEIICVNDGSTDGSAEILKTVCDLDNRVSVISKENGGQSSARNKGVSSAGGEYLYFMDADDLLEENALQLLYDIADKERLDVLYFDGVSFYEDDALAETHQNLADYYIRDNDYGYAKKGSELLADMVRNNEFRASPCLQLINKEFYDKNALHFKEGIIYEDNIFSFLVIVKAERAKHIPEILFKRRVRQRSTTTEPRGLKNFTGYYHCMYETMGYLVSEELSSEVIKAGNKLIYTYLKTMDKIYRNELTDDEREQADKLSVQMPIRYQYVITAYKQSYKAFGPSKEKKTPREAAKKHLRKTIAEIIRKK